MYSAREGGENPFQHACLEVRSGRRMEKREFFVLWLEKIVVNTLQGQKKKGRKNICNSSFYSFKPCEIADEAWILF